MEKQLPNGWVMSALGDFCDLINGDRGKNYPSKDKLSASGYPFVNAGHLDAGCIQDEGMNYIDEDRYDLLNSGKFTFGDILYCIRGSLGKLALNKNIEKGAIASSLIIIRPCQRAISLFVFYYLKSPLARQMINKFDNGTAQPNLSGADLAKFVFPLPPLNEQKRIVAKIEELFSELDKGIESLQTAREQLKVYRQAVLKHAFEGKLTEQWRKDNADKLESPEQLLARIQHERNTRYQQQLEDWKTALKEWEANGKEGKKPGKPRESSYDVHFDSEELPKLPTLPDSWMWIPFNELISGLPRAMQSGPFGSNLKHSEFTTSGKLVIGIDNVRDGYFIYGSENRISEEKFQELQKYEARPGDLLITVMASLGRTCVVPRDIEQAIITKHVYRVTMEQSILYPEFYNHLLQSHTVSRLRMFENAQGQTRPGLNSTILKELPVPLCSIEEQKLIVSYIDEKLSGIVSFENDVNDALKRAETLRQSILKKAFSGQLVPQDPNDEPASELLARIQAEKTVLSAKAKKTPAKRGRKVKEVSN